MQTHPFVESVPHGLRHPAAEKAPAAKRATPDERAKRLGTDEERRPAARQPAHMPRSYGAGF
jgi:hypothetical protein